MDHGLGDFHACRCTHRSPLSMPHARDLHTVAAAATSTKPPRPEAWDGQETSTATRTRPPRQCRRCYRPASSTPTPLLPHASVLHLHGGAAAATRRRPTPPRVAVASGTHPPPPWPPSLLQQPVTMDELWSIMRQQSSKILPFVYLQNNVSIFTPSLGNSTKNWEKMSVSSQMYWMQMFTFSVICRLPAFYSIRGLNWENEKMLRC
jgi:hypothetical protein